MDAEDAAVDSVQAAAGDPRAGSASAQSGLTQLGEGDQVKLPAGASGDRPVDAAIGEWRRSVSRLMPIAGHGLMLKGSDAQVVLRK